MRDPFGSATSVADGSEPERARPEWLGPEPERQRPEWLSAEPAEQPSIVLEPVPTQPLRPRRLPRGARSAAGIVLAIAAGFAGGKLAGGETTPAASKAPATQASNAPATTSTPSGEADLTALYKAVAPSVVQIVTSGGGDDASGSGVIIDAGGTILTNNHVVPGDSVRVLLSNGREVSGTVAGRDTRWDLAVVKLTNAPDGLVAAKLGDSSKVVTGQTVVAIGAPFGLRGSYSSGIVSAINRTFSTGRGAAMRGLIQTDAAINPGNSGGPLFNLAGEVIGITTAIESPIRGSVGVGFAVPINQAQAALPSLVRGVAVQHPFLGIEGDAAAGGGVTVVSITPGTSAAGSELRAGDVITAIAGSAVSSIDELARALETRSVGEKVILTVRRGSATLEIPVTLLATQGG